MTTIDRSKALIFTGGALPINGVSPGDLAQERNARTAGDENLQTQISSIVDGSAITTENSFATRDAFVAWDATATGKIAGMVIYADGLPYAYDGLSTAIPDLPGWVPGGAVWDIRQWGAVEGQASQDCGAILQRALEAARAAVVVPPRMSGAAIRFPAGEWWFATRAEIDLAPTGTVAGPLGLEVFGDGAHVTSLIARADNSAGLMDLYSSRGMDVFMVRGMSILSDLDADAATNNGIGVSIRCTNPSGDVPRVTVSLSDLMVGGYGLTAGDSATRGNWMKGLFVQNKYNPRVQGVRALARYSGVPATRTACSHAVHFLDCYSPEIIDTYAHGGWERGVWLEASPDLTNGFEDFRLMNCFLVGQDHGFGAIHPFTTETFRLYEPGGAIMGLHVNSRIFGVTIRNHRQVTISGVYGYATNATEMETISENLPSVFLLDGAGDIRIDAQILEPGFYESNARAACGVRIEGSCEAITIRGQFGHGGIGVLNNSTFTDRKSILIEAEMNTSRRINSSWPYALTPVVDNAGTATLMVRNFGTGQDKIRHLNAKPNASTYPIAMQVGTELVGQQYLGAYEILGKSAAGADLLALVLRAQLADSTQGAERSLLDTFLLRNGSLVQGMRLNPPVADGSTALAVLTQTDGSVALKYVVVGAPDSGGAGYRMLRVAN